MWLRRNSHTTTWACPVTARMTSAGALGGTAALSMRGLLPVAGSWSSLLPTLIPLALVTAVSPLSIVPAVLVLHAPRPRPTGLAFLGGWLFGLAALTAPFVAGSGVLGQFHKSSPPTW